MNLIDQLAEGGHRTPTAGRGQIQLATSLNSAKVLLWTCSKRHPHVVPRATSSADGAYESKLHPASRTRDPVECLLGPLGVRPDTA